MKCPVCEQKLGISEKNKLFFGKVHKCSKCNNDLKLVKRNYIPAITLMIITGISINIIKFDLKYYYLLIILIGGLMLPFISTYLFSTKIVRIIK